MSRKQRTDEQEMWLIADHLTVHDGDKVIPPGTPFQGDRSLIERGIARPANRDETGKRNEG